MFAPPLHAEEQKVLLDLTINQSSQQSILVIIKGEQILIKTKDLETVGLKNFSGEKTVINNENYTILNSLGSILSYQLNLEKFTLNLTVQSNYLRTNTIT